jgi:hypothetical protein
MAVAIYLVYLGTSISSRLAAPRHVMACEERRNRKRLKSYRPCFGRTACAFGLVLGREEALTQNISHAPSHCWLAQYSTHDPCRVVHRASIPERKGTLHATHTPGSARRPAAQKSSCLISAIEYTSLRAASSPLARRHYTQRHSVTAAAGAIEARLVEAGVTGVGELWMYAQCAWRRWEGRVDICL